LLGKIGELPTMKQKTNNLRYFVFWGHRVYNFGRCTYDQGKR